ncbi:alpha/beta hydrolase [Corynebacterium epidermidicanis]|uniref:Lysophospholipase n=1 Tax=Corynebacterium epidermidicanis TaxID=1050174 RepID=A0A0G3GX10_9CORY|nr:alpha/beta hydrolase [Corynebacterium epidermidicanis]AKK03392.1 lysophospholipase [Corynebacterium epidermidicanis]
MEDLPFSEDWDEDVLGDGFQRRTFELGPDPDVEPPIVATVVRYFPSSALNFNSGNPSTLQQLKEQHAGKSEFHSRPAIMYVPGTRDYFFHRHVAEYLHQQGFAVYVVDLRKCGRSHRKGQLRHYVSDAVLYFKDLKIVSEFILAQGHPQLIAMGYSFSGQVLAHWLDHLRRTDDQHIRPAISGSSFNNPWIELTYPDWCVRIARVVAPILATWSPEMRLYQKKLATYVESLHKDYHGEWDFDLTYKPRGGHTKYWGWVNEAIKLIDRVQSGAVNCGVPVLVMCSLRSSSARVFGDDTHTTDLVLNVDRIINYASLLGSDVTYIPIKDATHDVFLSQQRPRAQALHTCIDWLRDTAKLPSGTTPKPKFGNLYRIVAFNQL